MKKDEFADTERRWRRRSLFHDAGVPLWRKALWIALAILLVALILYVWIWIYGSPIGNWLAQ